MLEGRRPHGFMLVLLFALSAATSAASVHVYPLRDAIEDTE